MGTLDICILQKYEGTNDLQLLGWTNLNYTDDDDDKKNTPGNVFMTGSRSISWS